MPSFSRPRKPFILVPDGSLDVWTAAKAASPSSAARVLILGDSLGQGNNATSRMTQSFFGKWRQALTGSTGSTVGSTPYALGGDWWPCSASIAGDASYGAPVPWVLSNTPTFLTTGYGKTPLWSGTPTNPATFTSPYAHTDADIHYLDIGTGTWTYTVDGGGAVTITLANTGLQRKVALTGLSNATHTIVFTGQSAVNVLQPQGISIYPTSAGRTSGIQFAWGASGGQELTTYGPLGAANANGAQVADAPSLFAGRYGAVVTSVATGSPPVVTLAAIPYPLPTVGQYVTLTGVATATSINATGNPPAPLYRLRTVAGGGVTLTIENLDGTSPSSVGAGTGGFMQFHTGFGFPAQPHLTILELAGGGDCINFRGVEAFEETYRRMVSALWRGVDKSSILVVTGSVEWPTTGTNVAAIPNAKYFHKYTQIARSIADEYGLAWLNLLGYFGSGQVTSGYFAAGDFHPGNTGHAAIATLLGSIV